YRAGEKPGPYASGDTAAKRHHHKNTATGAEEGAQHTHHIFYTGHVCEPAAAGYSDEPAGAYIWWYHICRPVHNAAVLLVFHLWPHAGNRQRDNELPGGRGIAEQYKRAV